MSQTPKLPIWASVGTFVLGVVVAAVGTTVHRYHLEIADKWVPLGIFLTLLSTAVASIFARSVANWLGVLGFALGWFLAIMLLSVEGPGGDTLIVGDWLGYVWSYGGMLIALTGFLTPRKWLIDAESNAENQLTIDTSNEIEHSPWPTPWQQ